MGKELVEGKKPYKSKTVLVNAAMGIVGIVVMLGIAPEGIHSWMQENVELLLTAMGVVGVLLRLVTKGKIELKD